MPQPSVHQLYTRLETIGKGAYGSVHKGIHIPTGKVVALKIINLDTEDDDVGDIQREVALLTQLRDAPNITQYFGCYLDGPRVWIVMEYAEGGSVRTLMKACKDNIIEEKYAVIIIREVLQGLRFLHKSSIIHRDLKAANILVTATGKRNTLIGTPHWMAPEVAHAAAYDTKADIWSLGIAIYEMVKGNVPHAQIFDQAKLIQMIPRMKPPRLIEGEGSKELREFVSQCLRESPKDRLTADELLKTKLIRSILKTPNSILTDLITRYEAWVQEGNTRASMMGSLPWEDEENEERDFTDVQRESTGWEFETVRGRSAMDFASHDTLSPPDVFDDDSASYSTVRPPTSKVPPTLRMLFEDDTNDTSPFPMVPPIDLPMPTRSRTPLRARGRSNSVTKTGKDEMSTVKQTSDFVFPRKPVSEAKPQQDADETSSLNLEFSFSQDSLSSSVVEDVVNDSHNQQALFLSSDPTGSPEPPPVPDSGATVTQQSVSEPQPLTTPGGHRLTRKRSQSSAAESASRTVVRVHRDRNLASSVDFHFPSRPSSGFDPDLSSGNPSTSTSINSPFLGSSHHPAASLDASILPKRLPSPGSLPRPQAITRKGSAPVLEISRYQGQAIYPADAGPFSRHGLPGLKDVLKIPAVTSELQLGMSDLLPPSPFLQHSQQPSPPSTSYAMSTTDPPSRPWPLNASASSSTTSLNSLSSLQSQSLGDGIAPSPGHFRSRSQGFVSSLPMSSNPMSGPIVKPLDFSPLTQSHEKTHAYLASTVNDLAQWLSMVELGLTQILDETSQDAIVEEQEPEDQHVVTDGAVFTEASAATSALVNGTEDVLES
ncbi:unnamed protein product [Somion occarium]|uniref:non-specific serine/threonine protein kinase n=1 Tax=Somion occarium TaxID=3059160 RepID=A0ABP1DGN7_9APHY